MSTGIRSDASGTFGALTFGGDDTVTFDATGIQAGSYKAGSIVAADLANGALIENAPVGIGYGAGAGGTVAQATSKSTAVTLNKPTGQITMNAASLAASAAVSFTLNNSLMTTADTVVVTSSGALGANYHIEAKSVSNGSVLIFVTNVNPSPLSEAVVINFAVIKGATS